MIHHIIKMTLEVDCFLFTMWCFG